MTAREFTDRLPVYTNNPIPSKPPFVFRGLSARVFPLRASLDSLQQLCDGYLNIVPPEAAYFRAAAPYAYLMVLDYSQMGEAFLQSGWFSQTEVFFGLTLEWYKRVNGRFVFHDWAVTTPYIFVDDDFSMPLGRTVYGFQKILAQVVKTEDAWMKNTLAPSTLARIDTQVFPEAYAGSGAEWRTLLEIEKSTSSTMCAPFDARNPMMPWMIASNLAGAIGGFGRDALWMMQMMRISPVNPLSDPSFLPAMFTRMLPWFAPDGKGFIQNSINLKQFRNSEDPSLICFQALTSGSMQTTGFNGGGMLGEERLLLGDLSGGHSVRVYEYSSLPIVRTLGLEVHRQWQDNNITVSELKPIAPMWLDIDIQYYGGRNLAWRTDDGVWKDEGGKAFYLGQQSAKKNKGPKFNGAVASAIEAVAGPFQFADSTIRVLPLLADKATLQQFLDGYMNKPLEDPIVPEGGGAPEQVRFTVWARPKQAINPGIPIGGDLAYVYLTATSYGNVSSGTNNVGNWAKYEIAFMIPVKFERKVGDAWTTVGVGLVPSFTFVDNCIAAFSRFEVQGIDAATANFLRPESQWLSSEGELAGAEQILLRVDSETYSAYTASEKARIQPVIEIMQGAGDCGLGDAPDAPWAWSDLLRREQGSKNGSKKQHRYQLKAARSLALELLGNQTPFSIYTLKQVRDVADPDKAAYQSVVRVERALKEVYDVREIEDTLVVRIHNYPSLQIAMALGIVSERLGDNTSGVIHTAQAVRPFYIRATLLEPLSDRLLSRSGESQWTLECNDRREITAFQTLLSYEPGSPNITADWRAETLVDQVNPTLTATIMAEARQNRMNWSQWDKNEETKRQIARYGAALQISPTNTALASGPIERDDEGAITKNDARAALDVIDPQMIIESALSREWSNYDPNARWRAGRAELIKSFGALPQRGAIAALSEAELYRKINNALTNRPGAVAGELPEPYAVEHGDPTWNPSANSSAGQPSSGNASTTTAPPARSSGGQPGAAATTALPASGTGQPGAGNASRTTAPPEAGSGGEPGAAAITPPLPASGATQPGANLVQEAPPPPAATEEQQRWIGEMRDIIARNQQFAECRQNMEKCIDVLAPFDILGLAGVQQALKQAGGDPVSEDKLVNSGWDLIQAMRAIQQLQIAGEPSERNNLDAVVQAQNLRLRELLDILERALATMPSGALRMQVAVEHAEQFREAVALARKYCEAQHEALLNKLSRAYQKPDFCIRRDALGPHCDRLLPLPFSWDQHWYYGEEINLEPLS